MRVDKCARKDEQHSGHIGWPRRVLPRDESTHEDHTKPPHRVQHRKRQRIKVTARCRRGHILNIIAHRVERPEEPESDAARQQRADRARLCKRQQ